MDAQQTTISIFGLTQEQITQRMSGLDVAFTLQAAGEDVRLTMSAEDSRCLDTAVSMAVEALGVYCYSRDGLSLSQRVVQLLRQHRMSVALAERGSDEKTAAAMLEEQDCRKTGISAGLVAFSCDGHPLDRCGANISRRTQGAVSRMGAKELALFARHSGEADLGLCLIKMFDCTVIALTDGQHTWLRNGACDADRAAAQALDLLRRYLEAYPARMAGGDNAVDAPAEQPKRLPHLLPRRRDPKRVFWLKLGVWLLVLTVVAVVSLLIYYLLGSSGNNRELQDDLRQIYRGDTSGWSNSASPEEGYTGMLTQFHSLFKRNSDVAGWVRIPDTVIDYPVMQYSGGHYTNHGFNGRFSHYGQPYFDALDNFTTNSTNKALTVHGNNTRDGQMFSELLSYRRIAFLKEHPFVELNTLYAAGRYEVFAVLVMDEEDSFQLQNSFRNDGEYEKFIRQLCSRSLYISDHPVSTKDHLLFLSTGAAREYGYDGARFVVAARRLSTAEAAERPIYRVNDSGRFPDNWFMQEDASDQVESTTATAVIPSITEEKPPVTTADSSPSSTVTVYTTTTQQAETTATTTQATTTTRAEEQDSSTVTDDAETEKDTNDDIRD